MLDVSRQVLDGFSTDPMGVSERYKSENDGNRKINYPTPAFNK